MAAPIHSNYAIKRRRADFWQRWITTSNKDTDITIIPFSEIEAELSWQQQLAKSFRDVVSLAEFCGLQPDQLQTYDAQFPLRVPLAYAKRIRHGDIYDPLLKQVLPLRAELQRYPGYSNDPLAERAANPLPGLIQKYRGRVLLVLNGNCAIHCRYCFRQYFPYAENAGKREDWQAALDFIARDPDISEVILSGGDPLTASDRRLRELTESLEAIPHIKRLRIHTRLPIVLPARITNDCVKWLSQGRLQPVVVVHTNHPREIDEDVRAALARLKSAGISLFNQSVLLKSINDDVDVLATLSEDLFAAGVIPYYLHTLDKVHGSAHFDVPETKAKQLLIGLRHMLPGYLVPKLVKEQPDMASKTPIF